VEAELAAHAKNQTWSIVKLPGSGTLLSAKWVFKHKRDSAGNIETFKARLVARGFEQRQGINYGETFAPVARIESIRTILAIAAARDLEIERFDVSTAFLNGTIEEEIFVEPPDGVITDEDECLKLNKALYGLKQAPKVWNSLFDSVISKLGFGATKSDPCVYVDKVYHRYLAVYVDDGVIVAPTRQSCLDVIDGLNKSFKTNRVTGDIFLGIQIEKVKEGIVLSQSRYIRDMLNRFNMADCEPRSVPMEDTNLFEQKDEEMVNAPYRRSGAYCMPPCQPGRI